MIETPSPVSEPPKPNTAILEKRWLHYVMVLLSQPDSLPMWLNLLLLLVFWGLHTLVWYGLVPALALAATSLMIGVNLLDLALLWQLKRKNISHGPIPSQFVVLTAFRAAGTGLALLLALWQPTVGFGTLTVIQVLGTVSYMWGMWIEPRRLALTTLALKSPHLASDAPPIRLLHISDLHVEYLTQRESQVLSFIDQAKPDLIVITGDFLNLSYNRDPISIRQVRLLLAKIDAPYGVYATLGSPPVDVPDVAPLHFVDSHIRLLRGDVAEIDVGEGRTLTLIGMDCTHDMAYDQWKFGEVSRQRNGRNTTVLLYHSPELMPFVRTQEVDLFLCGHTHGGQVRLPFYGAILTSACTGKQYEMGRYDENGTTLYVSRGIGLEGLSAPRIRLLCPPEMTLVMLSGK